MDLSIFLAKLFGLYLIIACAAIFVNRKRVSVILKGFKENLGLVVFTGFIHLFLGLIVVLVHNVWTLDYRSIITFLGWVGIFKGSVRLIFPEKFTRFSEEFSRPNKLFIWGLIWFFVGIYLTYIGFFG